MRSGGRREHHGAKGTEVIPLLTKHPSGLVPAASEVILGMRMMGYLAGKGTCSDEKEDGRLLSFT